MLSILQNFDINTLELIRSSLHNTLLDKLMPVITSLGNRGLIWLAIAIALLFSKKYRLTGFMVIGALLLSSLTGDVVLKHLFQRPRPFIYADMHDLLIPEPTSYSFPSGHTATAFASAGILAGQFKNYRTFFWISASLIAFSRMYLYVHYPTDIIGGIAVGLICSKAVSVIVERK